MALIYADENFPSQTVAALRVLGHDVLTAQQAGQAGQAIADELVLAFGTKIGRAVITLDRKDFIRLHKRGIAHAGIIVCSQDPDPRGQADRVHAQIAAVSGLSGQLVRVYRPEQR